MNENNGKMTQQQFYELASRKPVLNEDCVYRYEAFEIAEICASHPYPEFGVCDKECVLFRTFDDAERFMHDNIRRNTGNGNNFYCHVITVIPWGKDIRNERARFLYDYAGNLLDYTATCHSDDMAGDVFLGRTPDRIRFRRGDLVEVRENDSVRLGIIWYPETTVDECWNLYQNADDADDPYRCLSTCDDRCVVIFGPGYDEFKYVQATDIMAPTFCIEDELRKNLMTCLKESIESENHMDEMDGLYYRNLL